MAVWLDSAASLSAQMCTWRGARRWCKFCLLDALYSILDVPPAAEELGISTDDKQGDKERRSDAALW